ncbi:MAG: hypothetical protein QOF61_911 [Acidobacteriota bacterium]|nr:hypothetical protein [Acidobacteriota bacterium]
MPSKILVVVIFLCAAFVASDAALAADSEVEHLTIYDAGVAQFLEVRTLDLQPGLNQIEWRSLMPQAFVRTLRVTAEGAEVVRQDVTYDGAEVRGSHAPVLHLVLRNAGAGGARRVRVDYLAPSVSWQNDYLLVLATAAEGAPTTSATLDSWVSILNSTGTDIAARRVDLIAGEIALLNTGGYSQQRDYSANVAQAAAVGGRMNEDLAEFSVNAAASAVSAFSRFRLGDNISINANAPVNRFPLFQNARLEITERNVFENDYNTQTLGRGGFNLLPRGLEVRLVSRNTAGVPMPAGQMTIYARTADGVAQIVGQDRIALTPVGAEFSVSQGRSSTLLGTRRILERRVVNFRTEDGGTDDKLVTRVEVVLTNRGAREAETFVRETIEPHDDNQWTITESSAPPERLSANTVQFKLRVPAGGKQTLTYTVETR